MAVVLISVLALVIAGALAWACYRHGPPSAGMEAVAGLLLVGALVLLGAALRLGP